MERLFEFLHGLKENNHKDWFHANKSTYDELRKNFEETVGELITMISATDPHIGITDPRDCMFRINRDIRFSKNKTPYKTHMSAFISYEGRKSSGPGYYFHLEPGNSMFGAGVYLPEAAKLEKIRYEIDYNGAAFEEILNNPAFKKRFGELEEVKLKRPPKGFSEDHPFIHLLKYKSFFSFRKYSDDEVMKNKFMSSIKDDIKLLYPYNQFFYKSFGLEDQ
ncbi:MAG: DUF2461 domain-containing protein [Cytophagaceae bacterium]